MVTGDNLPVCIRQELKDTKSICLAVPGGLIGAAGYFFNQIVCLYRLIKFDLKGFYCFYHINDLFSTNNFTYFYDILLCLIEKIVFFLYRANKAKEKLIDFSNKKKSNQVLFI